MTEATLLDPSTCEVHNLNVISSTKIHQKVNQVLRIFHILPPVTPSAQDKEDDATTTKAGAVAVNKSGTIVVELKARSNVASKLISIVEILKRDLAKREKEREELHTGASVESEATDKHRPNNAKDLPYKLYQYTTVSTTRIQVKAKPPKQQRNTTEERGAALQDTPAAHASTTEPVIMSHDHPLGQGQKRKRPVDSSQDSVALARSPLKKTKTTDQVGNEEGEIEDGKIIDDTPNLPGAVSGNGDEKDDEDDEAFEEMRTTSVGTIAQAEEQEEIKTTQERDIPLLTIYLSMSPIPKFAAAYGEQTG